MITDQESTVLKLIKGNQGDQYGPFDQLLQSSYDLIWNFDKDSPYGERVHRGRLNGENYPSLSIVDYALVRLN